jgi:hypothetical protein
MATRSTTTSLPSTPPTNEQKSSSKAVLKSVSASRRPDAGPRENEQAAKSQSPTAVQPVEPEDAYLTGVSRSLQRRLLGLNVQGAQGQAKPIPEATVPGIHSTGSYTGSAGVKTKTSSEAKSGKRREA